MLSKMIYHKCTEIGFGNQRRMVMSPKANGSITIYDVAREAGVSASTVSRVMTGNVKVSKEKAERVKAIVEKYNFKPNLLAKGLSGTKSGLIGIVSADIRNPFYAATFVACEEAARKAGYTVMVCNSLNDKEREIDHLNTLKQQQVDAIIQLGGLPDDIMTDIKYAEAAKKIVEEVPMVVTGKIDGVCCYQVRIDACEASTLLTEHLISLGHKRIALVGGRMDVTSTYEKYVTYRKILKQHGIEFRKEYVIEGNYSHETGYAGVKKLLGLKEMPTAIIAINDFCASGVLRGISEMGLSIPGDISVVSYDNTYIADLSLPKLTSIDYDYATFGAKLVDAAIAGTERLDVPTLQMVTPHLVVRESSGMAKK